MRTLFYYFRFWIHCRLSPYKSYRCNFNPCDINGHFHTWNIQSLSYNFVRHSNLVITWPKMILHNNFNDVLHLKQRVNLQYMQFERLYIIIPSRIQIFLSIWLVFSLNFFCVTVVVETHLTWFDPIKILAL